MKRANPRKGAALVSTIALLSLITILAVATLSLSSRLGQGGVLGRRDAVLDAAAGYGLASVATVWREKDIGGLAVGATTRFGINAPGLSQAVSISVTRLNGETFWAVAEAWSEDGSTRRENLILRVSMPAVDSLPTMRVSGNVTLSQFFVAAADSSTVCPSAGADVWIDASATISSALGPLPALVLKLSGQGDAPLDLSHLGHLSLDSVAMTADEIISADRVWVARSGIVHALGDLTISGGVGEGILIVDGTLAINGIVSYSGLIVARGGIQSSVSGVTITGAVRSGGDVRLTGSTTLRRSACTLQAVLAKSLTPRPVQGRRWGEMYQ